MKSTTKVALASTLLAAGLTVTVAPPANAGWPGGIVTHAADDSGYNPPIFFGCDNGYRGSLGLGSRSKTFCADANWVWVASGDVMKCYHAGDGRWFAEDGPDYIQLGNITNIVCYQQKA
jgi:hypothetical protein